MMAHTHYEILIASEPIINLRNFTHPRFAQFNGSGTVIFLKGFPQPFDCGGKNSYLLNIKYCPGDPIEDWVSWAFANHDGHCLLCFVQ